MISTSGASHLFEQTFLAFIELFYCKILFLENCQEFSRIFTSRSRSRSILISLFTSQKRVKAFIFHFALLKKRVKAYFFHFALLEKEWKLLFFTFHFSNFSDPLSLGPAHFRFLTFTCAYIKTNRKWNDQNCDGRNFWGRPLEINALCEKSKAKEGVKQPERKPERKHRHRRNVTSHHFFHYHNFHF